MDVNRNTAVRELALGVPGSTRVFERLKIDYCCGGALTLTDACANAGVRVEEVIKLLGREAARPAAGAGSDFRAMPLAGLVRHIIEKHHAYAAEEMEGITALVAKVAGKHGGRHPELLLVARLFEGLCAELRPHMFREEQILLPFVVALEAACEHKAGGRPFAPFGTINNPVRAMMSEHDAAGDLLRELRAASKDYAAPDDACTSYRTLYARLEAFEADLHQHIHLENNILFPRALELENAAYAAA